MRKLFLLLFLVVSPVFGDEFQDQINQEKAAVAKAVKDKVDAAAREKEKNSITVPDKMCDFRKWNGFTLCEPLDAKLIKIYYDNNTWTSAVLLFPDGRLSGELGRGDSQLWKGFVSCFEGTAENIKYVDLVFNKLKPKPKEIPKPAPPEIKKEIPPKTEKKLGMYGGYISPLKN